MAKVTKKSYLIDTLTVIIRFLVKVERNIWWHFGISMPLYSHYWKRISENRQVELNPVIEKIQEVIKKRKAERWPEPVVIDVREVIA